MGYSDGFCQQNSIKQERGLLIENERMHLLCLVVKLREATEMKHFSWGLD
jgi:hypothetical protein